MPEYKYAVGDTVEVNDWSGARRWRLARITRLAPMGFRSAPPRPGYDVLWLDGVEADPISGVVPSQGGWTPETCVRPSKSA